MDPLEEADAVDIPEVRILNLCTLLLAPYVFHIKQNIFRQLSNKIKFEC